MRYLLIVLWMLFWPVSPAMAQVSIGIGLPGLSIGINFPMYPELVQVPGYPVYYAPRLNSNYFFYDGMYWVYQGDNWYASSWYNGPWGLVGPEYVPLFVLRIPVRYYRQPPAYFRGWRSDAPPRWGEHWGNQWEQDRRGWDKWNHASAPRPAPLPVYQRQYSGDRYPRVEQQQALRSQKYNYQPREAVVQQHYREQAAPKAPAPSQRSNAPAPVQPSGPAVPRSQPQQRGNENVQRPAPVQAVPQPRGPAVQEQKQQQPQQGAAQRQQQTPRQTQENQPKDKGTSQAPGRGQGQEKDREKGDERGQERNK